MQTRQTPVTMNDAAGSSQVSSSSGGAGGAAVQPENSSAAVGADISIAVEGASEAQPETSSISTRHSSEALPQQPITPENLNVFCEQLRSFIKCVKSVQDNANLTYNVQSLLQESLELEAKELEFLYGEVKAAITNMERMKAQRKAIRKEKYAAERILKKIKEEEMREMETVISVYDRGMFTRWEIVKNSKKLEAVENFLSDIEGKLLAMKHLKLLASQKMNKIISWSVKESSDRKMRKEQRRLELTTVDSDGTKRTKRAARTRGLSKTELPQHQAATDALIRQPPVYAPLLYNPDDPPLSEMSQDSIRIQRMDGFELNTEMQSVLRTLFGAAGRHDNNVNTNNTATNSSTNSTADSHEIHLFLSHSYQN